MQLAINTASLDSDTPRALERAQALGFTHVEINIQTAEFGYDYRRRSNARFYRTLRRQLDELGLRAWSVTPPPLTQAQMFSAQARKDILMGSAVAAGLLGAQVFTVRPEDIFISEAELATYIEQKLAPPTISGYDEAWVQAANRRVILALRNTDDWIGLPLVNQPARMDKLTHDLAIGWSMDVHQAFRRGQADVWLDPLGSRLALAYAYDIVDDAICAPQRPEWTEWLGALAGTRLKTLVMQAGPDEDDAAIQSGRALLQAAFAPA